MATLEPEAVTANLNKALFINGCEKKDFERFLKGINTAIAASVQCG